jgi:hypothetical protein
MGTDLRADYGKHLKWASISDTKLAKLEGLLGSLAFEVQGVYWRRVRLGFCRPLVQFRSYASGSLKLPKSSYMGGAQYSVLPGGYSNSHLNCLVFEDARNYSVADLDAKRARQVRFASKHLEVRPISDLKEFIRDGYLAYASFYERTQYNYGDSRRDPHVFAQWAEGLFEIPELAVLGAYNQKDLIGVSLSYLVDSTVVYATFFCTTPSLKFFVSDLMLHHIRAAASKRPEVTNVFAGLYKGNVGLDGFYFSRGAICVRRPALLSLNPAAQFILRLIQPQQYKRMVGTLGTA